MTTIVVEVVATAMRVAVRVELSALAPVLFRLVERPT